MIPLEHPKTGFTEINWLPKSAIAVSQSRFTFKQQVYRWPGQLRTVSVSLPPLRPEQAKAWKAFFYALNGQEGTFYLSDTIGKDLHGSGRGEGIVSSSGQTGSSLVTSGWLKNQVELFKAGDMVSINDRIYDITADVSSDATGNATLKIWPFATSSLKQNDAISIDSRGVFRLQEFPEHGWSQRRLAEGIQFTAIEAL